MTVFRDRNGIHVIDDDDVAGLFRTYGERWQLRRPLGMWTAERVTGRKIRYVVAASARELADKLAAIESGDD